MKASLTNFNIISWRTKNWKFWVSHKTKILIFSLCNLSNAIFWEYACGAYELSETLDIYFKCVTCIVVKHACGYGLMDTYEAPTLWTPHWHVNTDKILRKSDMIQCNHKCRVGVGHTFNQKCPCNKDGHQLGWNITIQWFIYTLRLIFWQWLSNSSTHTLDDFFMVELRHCTEV